MNSNIKDVYGLTPSQEGIYAGYFQSSSTKTYHLQGLCRISKNTDTDLIRKSVELLSLRHPVLKTAFAVLKSTGAVKQVILENRKPEFSILLKNEPYSEMTLDSIIDNDINKAFDLQQDPLFRVTVVDFTDERFIVLNTHHIILDGWCLPVIINDLQNYYDKLAKGISERELAAETDKEISAQTSYAQYAGWIKKQDKNEASRYWQNLLSDCSPARIYNKKKTAVTENEVVTLNTPLRDELSQHIDRFAKENRISRNTVFECAFGIILQKFSGNEDIVFDKVISGRSIPLKNIENTVGPFINTVPVRIRINEETSVADLLNETQTQTVNANKYGILPLAEIYKNSDINSQSVDALFTFENYYTGDISDMGNGPLSLKLISFREQTDFRLNVSILKENNIYTVRTSYDKTLYTEKEMSAFVNGYISVLEAFSDKTKKIRDISVTDMSVIDEFNSTAHSFDIPADTTIFSLFKKTAEENKDKICIKTAEKDVTFGELLGISEKLDASIRNITNGKKSVIAVIAERSPEMYSAVYGIIRGGNAYLPIDPDYPKERIDYILGNSNASVVVTQGKFRHLSGAVPCIDITEFICNSTLYDAAIPPCIAEENDTAYVIYTSGSTGNPKGAAISHRSAVNRILWMHDRYPLGNNDVILQKTPYTFDVSVWELFWWGMCGGCLAVSKPGEHFLPAKILDEVKNRKVTHLHFVPSVFELFLNYLEAHTEEIIKFSSVKYVFLSGEALTANLVNRFYSLYDYGKVSLHNLYGPTECTVDVTYFDCVPDAADPVPIGRPVYNTQMYVVDKYMKPVPTGVTGELCIAGVNVGQGYINNPVLTAEKFIRNPFGEGRLYKTGDIGYLREDGNIVFEGRNDFQIKLNGQRIETGEIETVIKESGFAEAVVVIVNSVNDRDVLIAFYTGKNGAEESIKEHCYAKLPKYMVPSAVVHIEELPLNKSGKLDRKVLKNFEFAIPSDTENKEPVNDEERLICEAFCSVLGVENVNRSSDFFELGGSSLSMISVLSEPAFENITAAEFMRNSTPSALALLMKNKNKTVYEYLEPLYTAEKENRILIVLPFAGGGPEAYSNLAGSIRKKHADTSLYFIRYLHSDYECRKAADEIITAFKGKDILIYSHCVGSAVALPIIQYLESQNVPVRKYFAGASIPPAKAVKKNFWNIVPDRMIDTILTGAGADIKNLPEDKLDELLDIFRKDTDFANISFADFKGRIITPVCVVISKNDIFTKNYKNAEKLWKKYAANVVNIEFIEGNSHYFQSESSDILVDMILQ